VEYDQAARKRLGREVRAARRKAGYENREDFAAVMKPTRSARQVQALENGESGVGPDTWAAAAEALGWDVQRPYDLLEGKSAESPPPELTTVSDDELAAEVLRRMKRGDGDVGRDATPTNVTPLTSREKAQKVQKKAAQSKPRTDT
jgi:hypothetical protein